MGNSMPPPASFDLIDSVARLRGTDVEIVLAEPVSEIAGDSVEVSLRRGRRTVRAHGELGQDRRGHRLVVRVPRAKLGRGVWSLTLEHGAERRQRLAARLLVQGDRPLVLLWGAKDPASVAPPVRAPRSPRRRAAAASGRALDSTLATLAPERAQQLRESLRRAARRVLR